MIDYLKDKITDSDLLEAPKVNRTHCYVETAKIYDIHCLLCGSTNVEWSEYESHLWCYNCEKDVLLIQHYSGIFGGPIPVQLTQAMGISFDRINLETQEVVKAKFEAGKKESDEYNNSWVKDPELQDYENRIYKKLGLD